MADERRAFFPVLQKQIKICLFAVGVPEYAAL
jgi:hypothetical protein